MLFALSGLEQDCFFTHLAFLHSRSPEAPTDTALILADETHREHSRTYHGHPSPYRVTQSEGMSTQGALAPSLAFKPCHATTTPPFPLTHTPL